MQCLDSCCTSGAVARASEAAVERALGDNTVDAGSASGDILPDHVAVVAETKLLLAVANDSAVGGASSACTTAGGGRRSRRGRHSGSAGARRSRNSRLSRRRSTSDRDKSGLG